MSCLCEETDDGDREVVGGTTLLEYDLAGTLLVCDCGDSRIPWVLLAKLGSRHTDSKFYQLREFQNLLFLAIAIAIAIINFPIYKRLTLGSGIRSGSRMLRRNFSTYALHSTTETSH